MSDERERQAHQQRHRRRHRRQVRWTVALLAGAAALIYLGFIGRGVIG